MTDKNYYMYVLLTADNTFYCGFTDNVVRRLSVHEAGKGAKYTRPKKRHPLRLVYSAEYNTKTAALRAEAAFKKLSRAQKEKFLVLHDAGWDSPQINN